MTRKQIGVAIGVVVGLGLTIGAFAWPGGPTGNVDRLSLWAACSAGPACWLALAVALQARHRFFSDADIDGAGLTAASARAQLLQALIQNTAEQTLLASLAYAMWLLAAASNPWTPIHCAMLFSLGRLLFFAGYAHGAAARSLGFALTFYPTVGLLALSLPGAVAALAACTARAAALAGRAGAIFSQRPPKQGARHEHPHACRHGHR
jgi:MAPEG family